MAPPTPVFLSSRQSPAQPPRTSPTPTNTSSGSGGDGGFPSYLIVVIVGIVIVLILIIILLLRSCRKLHSTPRYVPTSYLKERWVRWNPGKHQYQAPSDINMTDANHESQSTIAVPPETHTADAGTGGVDRHTSVRSIMTLPAYKATPSHDEQILGREGERGGIDIVLELPDEAAAEEEERREEEMNALYQVRLARRNEAATRLEERRLRNEARERGDWVALNELQSRSRANSAARAVEEARAERERIRAATTERGRAVSSVSYADLGVIRHDGTRLRANSNDSERQGLLGDAASIARTSYHSRQRSASSVLSIDTTGSDHGQPSPEAGRFRDHSPAGSVGRRSSVGGNMSSPELIDAPQDSPPGYENVSLDDEPVGEASNGPPPEYSSPIQTRNPELPTNNQSAGSGSTYRRGVGGVPQLPSLRLSSLPSIVVDSGTPVRRRDDESRATSPAEGA